ncbi:MAG: hypothetical protein IT256_03855 [Chitinophagaceae bacterium]|nr:hypothetical protein [Chitinophagaceae bacterium]
MKPFLVYLFFILAIAFGCNKTNNIDTNIGKYFPNHGAKSKDLFPFKNENIWKYQITNYDTNNIVFSIDSLTQIVSFYTYLYNQDTFYYIRTSRENLNDSPKMGKNYYTAYRNVDSSTVEGISSLGEKFVVFTNENPIAYYLGSYTYVPAKEQINIYQMGGTTLFSSYLCFHTTNYVTAIADLRTLRQIETYFAKGIGIVGKDIYLKKPNGQLYLYERWLLTDYYLN